MGWYVPNSRSVDLAAKETTLETVKKNANAALLQHQFSHVQLCDPRDGGPPGSPVPGILQARILEWVTISFSKACMHAKSLQSCPTLCHPMDSSPPGSPVHRTLQARILEWVVISFSQGTPYSFLRLLCKFTLPPTVYKIPLFSNPCQHLTSLVFLIIAIVTGVVLICIFLVFSKVEHLFMYLLSICMSSFG